MFINSKIRRRLVTGFTLAAILSFPSIPSAIAFSSDISPSADLVVAYPHYKIAAIMVTFPDNPPKTKIEGTNNPWTKQYVDGVLFSNTDSMAAYFTDVSNGEVSVTGTVFDNHGSWYTIDRPATIDGTCDWTTYFSNAIAAANPDIDYTQYNTIMVFAPQMTCSTGGLATSMPVPEAGNSFYGAVDVDGIMGSNPHHELGHLIGFGYANSWQCNAPGIMTGTNCRNLEYADRYNIMGATGSRMLLLTAQQLENRGWLLPAEVRTITADGDYTIQAYELQGTTPKVLKIPQAYDASGAVTSWYYLEYRQPIGFDLLPPRTPTIQELGVPNGVLVHVGSPLGDHYSSTLLDMTPGTLPRGHDIFDPALPLGYSYSDPVAGVSFGVLARNSTAMAIRVRFTVASLCEQKAPMLTAKAVKSSGWPSQELRYDVTVKNASVLCGKSTFDLRTVKAPAGWKITIDKKKAQSVILTSGQLQKFVVRLVAPRGSKLKQYPITLETRMTKKPTYNKAFVLKPTLKR